MPLGHANLGRHIPTAIADIAVAIPPIREPGIRRLGGSFLAYH
jgi:hypothetical protein